MSENFTTFPLFLPSNGWPGVVAAHGRIFLWPMSCSRPQWNWTNGDSRGIVTTKNAVGKLENGPPDSNDDDDDGAHGGESGHSIMLNCLLDNSSKWHFVSVLCFGFRERSECRIEVARADFAETAVEKSDRHRGPKISNNKIM